MKNPDADRFVRNLRASLGGKFRMPDETLAYYIEALSKWRLRSELWIRVLDRVVAENREGELPPLSRIYDVIKAEQSLESSIDDPGAYYCFRRHGKSYATRVWNDSGVWRLMRIERESAPSTKWRMVRTSNEFRAPDGAEDVHLALPDQFQAQQEELIPIPF